jgi:putative FmdB family regulatory protein
VPTYEYECKKCGYVFDRFQRITEKPLSECPECCGQVVRLPGPGAGIIFKGSGFYSTDYRSESYKRREKAEGPGSDGAAKSHARKPADAVKKTRESGGKGDGRRGAGNRGESAGSDTSSKD